jgi:hypothetical protein
VKRIGHDRYPGQPNNFFDIAIELRILPKITIDEVRMPTERRLVLFGLDEVILLLARIADKYPALIPGNLSALRIIEIMHNRDLPKLFHDHKTRMLALLKEPPKGDGVIFRIVKPSLLIGERTIGLFVPDSVILEVFLGECSSLKIMLPRGANKVVIVEECRIGLRITLGDKPLELAA